ncbi:hypothetical protein J6590_046731 [Homalodisca vitripennis]|nr:hypothetical protein J6590_046731 [Homalodisca vitripennis]
MEGLANDNLAPPTNEQRQGLRVWTKFRTFLLFPTKHRKKKISDDLILICPSSHHMTWPLHRIHNRDYPNNPIVVIPL